MTDKKVAYVCFWTRGEYSERQEEPFLIVETEERAREIVSSYSRRLAELIATVEITDPIFDPMFPTVRVDFLPNSIDGDPIEITLAVDNGIRTPIYGDALTFYYQPCEVE